MIQPWWRLFGITYQNKFIDCSMSQQSHSLGSYVICFSNRNVNHEGRRTFSLLYTQYLLYLTQALYKYLFNKVHGKTFKLCIGIPHFIASHNVMYFTKWRQGPTPAKRLWPALLEWSGPEPTMSLRYTCNTVRKKVQNEEKKRSLRKGFGRSGIWD